MLAPCLCLAFSLDLNYEVYDYQEIWTDGTSYANTTLYPVDVTYIAASSSDALAARNILIAGFPKTGSTEYNFSVGSATGGSVRIHKYDAVST